jgi:hypothetical protein
MWSSKTAEPRGAVPGRGVLSSDGYDLRETHRGMGTRKSRQTEGRGVGGMEPFGRDNYDP